MEESKSKVDEQTVADQAEQTQSPEFGVETYVELCNWLVTLMQRLTWPYPMEVDPLDNLSHLAVVTAVSGSDRPENLREWSWKEYEGASQAKKCIFEEQRLDLSCVATMSMKLLDVIAEKRANTVAKWSEHDKKIMDLWTKHLQKTSKIFLRHGEETS